MTEEMPDKLDKSIRFHAVFRRRNPPGAVLNKTVLDQSLAPQFNHFTGSWTEATAKGWTGRQRSMMSMVAGTLLSMSVTRN